MNRKDFFKEMYTSLFQTVKYAYEPILNDDLQKVEAVVEQALGIKWLPIEKGEDTLFEKLELKYIEGIPIIVFLENTNIQAMYGFCPECSNIIHVTALYSTGKCFNCGKEYNFKTKQGELQLETLPVKKKERMFYIGLEKPKKPGGIHA